jgi:hypothetical protein
MKPKYVIAALAVIAIVGFPVFLALKFQHSTGRKGGAPAPQTSARELASATASFVRDLVRHDPSELPKTTGQILEIVPFGTPLEAARKTMTEHHFVCSLDSYTNPAQMSNSAIWNTPFLKGGQRLTVTNVARLRCETNGCAVTFWMVNGETTSLSVKGQF